MKKKAVLSNSLQKEAKQILIDNDLGGYTIPCRQLYPFQWNWDSVINALGWITFDENRAWQEIEYLFKGQWKNGMIPHIIFHKESGDYFPGPDYWGVKNEPATSAISQPPILAFGCLLLYQRAKNKNLALAKIKEFYPKLCAYHLWWINERSSKYEGLVQSYHPWESGMDNSPAWDKALAAVPAVSTKYQRKDTNLIAEEQRPHNSEYDRYLYLVNVFKENNFNSEAINTNTPYKVLDIGIISLFFKSNLALTEIAKLLKTDLDKEIVEFQKATLNNIAHLFNNTTDLFHSYDILADKQIVNYSSSSFLTLFAGLANEKQAQKMDKLIQQWQQTNNYSLASYDSKAQLFEPKRYWRGSIWIHINWMIALGLSDYNFNSTSYSLSESSLKIIEKSRFSEYYSPIDAYPCGGDNFSWTAAVALYWLV